MTYSLITEGGDLSVLCQAIADSKLLGLDLETTGLDPLLSKIRLITITTPAGTWVVDVFKAGVGDLPKVLNNYTGLVVGHNIKFDQKFLLHHYGIEFQRVFDTFRASYMLYNGHSTITGHNLYDIQKRYLGLNPDTEADYGASDWSGNLTPQQLQYAAQDTIHLIPLFQKLKTLLEEAGLQWACQIEFGAILPEAAMELNGFPLDKGLWLRNANENKLDAEQKARELLQTLPHPNGQLGLFDCAYWNLDSSDQVLNSFARLGIHLPSTDKTELAPYATVPLVKRFIDYRKVKKKVTSFGEDYLEHLHPVTGRIHTSYWPLTGAGRYSSSNPNLQQLPRDKAFREAFRPSNGGVFILADYSQIELRLAAHIAREPTMTRLYQEGKDIHKHTACIISGKGEEGLVKEDRQAAKAVNFGLIYGMGWEKLQVYALVNYGVTLTEEQAKSHIRAYFGAYKKLRPWHRLVTEEGKLTGMSRTLSGRLRYLDPDTDFNEFKNTPVQGSGADGLKASLPLVYKGLRELGAKMVHMVHDEIIVETHTDCLEERAHIKEILEHSMQTGMCQVMKNSPVPVVAEGSICASWAEK